MLRKYTSLHTIIFFGLIPPYIAASLLFPVARIAKPQRVCQRKNQTRNEKNKALQELINLVVILQCYSQFQQTHHEQKVTMQHQENLYFRGSYCLLLEEHEPTYKPSRQKLKN